MRLLVVQALVMLAILGLASAKPSNAGTCSTEEEGFTYGIASDCKKYLLCKKGVLQIKECEKKNYDTVTGKCVKAGQATCAVETVPEPEPQPEPVPEPAPESEEYDEQYDYLCTKVLYGVRVHPTACDRYLVCNKEKARIELCEEGFIFLADSISCQPGNKVTCAVKPDESPTTEATPSESEPTIPSTEESGSGEESSQNTGSGEESSQNPGSGEESSENPGSGEESSQNPGSGEESSQNPGSGEETPQNPGTYDYLCAKKLLGSVAHPETCKKYISCFNKKATEQSCKKGYGYSSKLHLCVKQKNGACPDATEQQPTTEATPSDPEPTFPSTEETGSGEESSQNPGSGEETPQNPGTYDYLCAKTLLGSVAHPETCKKYISCFNKKATEQSCKKGYGYSSKLHLCVKQKNGSCPDATEQQPTTEATPSDPEPTFPSTEESGSGEESSQNPGSGEETPQNPGTYDYLCAKTLLGSVAHPETCKKYISCFNKKATEQSCKKGYGYSSKLHLCVKQKNGACPDATEQQPTNEATPSDPEPTFPSTEETGSGEESSQNPGSGEETPQNPGTYDYLCAKTLLGSVAHPETCKKYISCFNKKATEQSCKKGYGYSSKLHLCVKQKNGACPDATEQQPTTEATPSETEPTFPSTEESGSGEESSQNPGPGEESSQNPGSGEETPQNPGTYDYLCAKTLLGSVAHPETCKKYISCLNKKATEQSCKKGYGYSSKLHLCVKQKNGACPDATEQQPTTEATPSDPEPSFPSTEESGSGEESSQNPGSGEETPQNPGTYDYLCAKTLLGSVAHPETCKKYISCFNKKATEQSCKKGYGYSSKLHLCVKQKNGSCPDATEQQPTTEATPSDPEPTFPSTEESGSGEESSQNPGSGEETPQNPGTYDYLCAKTLLGSVAHPETCKKYISCFNKKATEQSCKKGYGYSSKLHLCVKQKNGACPDATEQQPTTEATPSDPEPTFPSTEESGSGEESSQNPGSGEETPQNPGTYDYLCAKTLLGSVAHPETCKKYISCFNKKATEQSCKKGYGYSSKLHLCVKQKNGACPDATEQQPTTEATPSDPEPTFPSTEEAGSGEESSQSPGSGEETPQNPGTYDYLCAKKLLGSVAHPETCKKYISCFNKKATEQSCKKGYGYSSKLHLCVKQKNGACPDATEQQPTTEATPSETESTFPTTDEPELTFSTTEEPEPESDGKYDYVCDTVYSGILAHPDSCIKYIICSNLKAKEEVCMDGYYFSSYLKSCIKGNSETCADNNGNQGSSSEAPPVSTTEAIPPSTTTEAIPPATGGDPGEVNIGCVEGFTGYLPIENDCTVYVYCYQGEPGVRACLQDYIYYDPFKACLPGDPVTCKLYSV